jgi:hypothetical protein
MWKERSWLNLRYYPGIFGATGKNNEILRISRLRAENWTWDIPSTKQKCLFSHVDFKLGTRNDRRIPKSHRIQHRLFQHLYCHKHVLHMITLFVIKTPMWPVITWNSRKNVSLRLRSFRRFRLFGEAWKSYRLIPKQLDNFYKYRVQINFMWYDFRLLYCRHVCNCCLF